MSANGRTRPVCELDAKNSATWAPNLRSLFVEREAHFERHLPMCELPFLKITARLGDLKPAHVANRFLRARQRVLHRLLEPIWGRTNQLDFFVNVLAHKFTFRRRGGGRQTISLKR